MLSTTISDVSNFIRFLRQNRKFKFVKKTEKNEILPHRKKYFSSGV
jgi:hypothetical protein